MAFDSFMNNVCFVFVSDMQLQSYICNKAMMLISIIRSNKIEVHMKNEAIAAKSSIV